jgi:hypothetical protein
LRTLLREPSAAITYFGKTVSFRLNPEQKIGTFHNQFDDVASQQQRPYLDQINKTGGTDKRHTASSARSIVTARSQYCQQLLLQ